MKQSLADEIKSTIDSISKTCQKDARTLINQPEKSVIIDTINDLQVVLFPGYFGNKQITTNSLQYSLGFVLERIVYNLSTQISLVLSYDEQYQTASGD